MGAVVGTVQGFEAALGLVEVVRTEVARVAKPVLRKAAEWTVAAALVVPVIHSSACATGATRRPVELLTYVDTGRGFEARCLTTAGDTLLLRVDVYAEGVFRIRLGAQLGSDESPVLAPRYWKQPEYEIIERPGEVTLITGELRLRVERAPLRLSFHGVEGELLAAEPTGGALWYSDDASGAAFELERGELLYGLGAVDGPLNRRGRTEEVWIDGQKGREALAPFVLSSRSYGLFLHSLHRSWFDLGDLDARSLRFHHRGAGGLDYFFIHASSPEKVVSRFTLLTGPPPLLSPSALGIILAVEPGRRDELVALVEEFRRRGLPLDALILNGVAGDSLSPGAAPSDWRALADGTEGLSVQIGNSVVPLVSTSSPRFEEGLERHYFVRNVDGSVPILEVSSGQFGCLVDFADSSAVDWWWREFVDPPPSASLAELRGASFPTLVTDLRRFDDGRTGREAHNLFPLLYARAVAHRSPGALLLLDGGFVGAQRFAAAELSSGSGAWTWLSRVVRRGLGLSLSGFPYWAAIGPAAAGDRPEELYIRSLQLVALCPLALLRGTLLSAPPWKYGENAVRVYRSFAGLRMQLLPFFFNLMVEAHKRGMPIWRPLALYYPEDPRARVEDSEFLLGRDLLVAPVLEPSKAGNGLAIRSVYLPEGEWYDLWSGLRFSGPRELSYKADLGRCPIFVRAGAIVPQVARTAYAAERRWDPITFTCYPGRGTSRYTFWYPVDGGTQLGRTTLGVVWTDTVRLTLEPPMDERGEPTPARGVVLRFPGLEAVAVRVDGKSLARLEDPSLADGRHEGWAVRRGAGLDLLVSFPANRVDRPLEVRIWRK